MKITIFAIAKVIIIGNFLFCYNIFSNAYITRRGISKNLQVLLLVTLASTREATLFFLYSNLKQF